MLIFFTNFSNNIQLDHCLFLNKRSALKNQPPRKTMHQYFHSIYKITMNKNHSSVYLRLLRMTFNPLKVEKNDASRVIMVISASGTRVSDMFHMK